MPSLPDKHTITYTQNGRAFIIDDTFINHWFSSLGRKNQNSPEIANQLLSQFGIKSAVDVIKFLQSPAGQLAEAMLQEKIATLIAQKASLAMQIEALAKERALAFMILGLLHKEQKEKNHIHAIIEQEEQNKKLLDSMKPTATTPVETDHVKLMLETYEEARLSIQDQLTLSKQFASELEKELAAHEIIILLFDQESVIYGRLLDDMYNIHKDGMLDDAIIKQKLTELHRLYEAELDEIHRILESSETYDEEDIIIRIQNNEGRKLQLSALHDFQTSLQPEEKIVQHQGKFYLLPVNKTINNLSIEDQAHAHAAFLSLKPKLERTRTLMNKSRALEQTQLAEKNQSLLAQIAFVQDQVRVFDNQLSSIQASIANLNQAIAQKSDASSQPAPTPTPKKPSSSKNTPSPSPHATPSIIYRDVLYDIRKNPERNATLSNEKRSNLANIKQATQTQQLEASANINVRPGAPISPLLMQTLLRYNYNNGVIAQRNQAMSPIQSPNQIKPPEAPTPLSMNPQMKPKGSH